MLHSGSSEQTFQRLRTVIGPDLPVETILSPSGKYLAHKFLLSGHSMAAATTGYLLPERRRIVRQLKLGLTEFYVHLERKRLQFGFDPVRALDLLEPTLDSLTDAEFHQSIVQLVARTRDRHLVFSGRDSLGVTAVLPFTIERFFDGDDEKYAITKIADGFIPKDLRIGAIVNHWNGIRIDRFVRLNANVFDGSHDAAAIARSLFFLASRSLKRFAPPLEDWVDLDFEFGGRAYRERFVWNGITTDIPITPSIGRNVIGFGGDLELLVAHQIRRVQFAPNSFDALPPASAGELGVPEILGRHFVLRNGQEVDVFQYGTVKTKHGKFGYVRLFNFLADNVDDIANALIHSFDCMPSDGLIIDLRGNSGGYIAAGERILQLLTDGRITPTRCQFRVTSSVRSMVEVTDEFVQWRQSIREAAATGEPFSQGYPIEGTDDDFNQIGRKYCGPVVIITDALAFSTADIFVAGFIDHAIGRVLCVDKNMAAAGSNNWVPWDVVRLYNPDFLLAPELKDTLEAGRLSPEVFRAFNQAGVSLSANAVLSSKTSEYDGSAWRIQDGTLRHVLRHLPWANDGAYVYLHEGKGGLADMPDGVTFGLTMRRCIRVEKSEGRLLEDLGIQPDVVYRMTIRDLLDRNRDLITRASVELV